MVGDQRCLEAAQGVAGLRAVLPLERRLELPPGDNAGEELEVGAPERCGTRGKGGGQPETLKEYLY